MNTAERSDIIRSFVLDRNLRRKTGFSHPPLIKSCLLLLLSFGLRGTTWSSGPLWRLATKVRLPARKRLIHQRASAIGRVWSIQTTSRTWRALARAQAPLARAQALHVLAKHRCVSGVGLNTTPPVFAGFWVFFILFNIQST